MERLCLSKTIGGRNERKRKITVLFLSVCLLLLPAFIAASPLRTSGHLQEQTALSRYGDNTFADLIGPQQPVQQLFDGRLNTEYQRGNFRFVTHNELLGVFSDAPFVDDEAYPQMLRRDVFQTDDRRLFDLSKTFLVDENAQMAMRFDRLYAEYTQDALVLRAGRQAITWGNGMAFQTLDLFNPFSPIEVNRDYKVGDDLLYAQWLFDSGSDLQFLFVPRRDVDTGNLTEDQNSYGLKFKGALPWDIEYDLLVSRHYGEALIGAGVSKEISGAIWRVDLISLEADGENGGISLVTNLDYSWTIAGMNVYGFLEYFYSGVGTDKEHYLDPPPDLRERIARQELFTLARNYLATGLRVEVHPLLQIVPTHIMNLDDTSGIAQVQFRYDAASDVSLVLGLDVPYGGQGTEFGGLALPPNDVLLDRGERVYLRSTYFF